MIRTYGTVRIHGVNYKAVVPANYLVIDQSRYSPDSSRYSKFIYIRVTSKYVPLTASNYKECPICGSRMAPRTWIPAIIGRDNPQLHVVMYTCGTSYILGRYGGNNDIANYWELSYSNSPGAPALIDIQCIDMRGHDDDTI